MSRPVAVDVGALVLLATGRYDISDDAVAIPYAKGRLPAELVFASVAVLELVAVELFVPWERLGALSWLRVVVLAASAYGVLWIMAWMAAERVRPHLVADEGLVLRWGHLALAEVPWTSLAEVRVHRRYSADDDRLSHDVPLQGTNLDIELREPLTVRIPFRRRHTDVLGISLGVDDPERAAELIRAHLTT